MKKLLPIFVLIAAVSLPGCAWVKRHTPPWRHAAAAAKPAPAGSNLIITPDDSLTAKVLKVNPVARIVVLDFPNGRLPKLEQHLFLYRAGLKTAELKVSGPQQETSIVADLLSGDAQVGDTVRDE